MPTQSASESECGRAAPGSDPPESLRALDLLLILAEWKRFVLLMTVGGGALMAAIASLLPPMFTATATILPPQQQQSTISTLLGQLGPIAGGAGNSLGLKNPSDVYLGILGSRTIADHLIKDFDLQRLYRAETAMEARRTLAGRSSFTTGKDPLIKISVEDHDPNLAAALANAYVAELHKQNSRLALTESAQRRLFFEQQMESQKKALAQSETLMKSTQERTGVLQVGSQVESVIRSMAQLRAEISAREVSLASLNSAATPQNPQVVRQETELASLRSQLRKLEQDDRGGAKGDPMIPASQVPKAGLEYVRALRDLKYNETLFELVSKQYEAARIDEAKDAPVIQVVDEATPPERKSWPPRAIFTAAGAAGFGLLACFIAAAAARLREPTAARQVGLLKNKLFG
jgi:uncharacterized protein involved in exopolysaccharide biosynthesis